MPRRRSPRARRPVAPRWAAAACLLLAVAAHVQGSVVKCMDADGNVTYQDSPCTPGQAGRQVALPKAETREDTSAWEAAARDAHIVKGMPKRWVLRARGTPAEIRPGSAREEATEIWRYAGKGGALLVGFSGPDVAWVRDALPGGSGGAASVAAAGALQGAHNRRFVIAGRYCEHVFAEIGAADRQEAVTAAPGAAAGIRYTYEPTIGDPQMRTVFTCADAKVADVERTVVK